MFARTRGLPARRTAAGAGRAVLWLTALLEAWLERRRQRRALLALSDDLLKDLGLTRADAEWEGSKPFWRG